MTSVRTKDKLLDQLSEYYFCYLSLNLCEALLKWILMSSTKIAKTTFILLKTRS